MTLAATNPEGDGSTDLVFVHLGTGPSRHLLRNVHSTERRFPHLPVTIVVDDPQSWRGHVPDRVTVLQHRASDADRALFRASGHDPRFRRDFWVNTSRRFLAIAQAQRTRGTAFLHIESDVVLQTDITGILEQSGADCAYSMVSENIGVGALTYFRDSSAAEDFSDFILERQQADPTSSDMYALGAYFSSGRRTILALPGAESPHSAVFGDDASPSFRHLCSSSFPLFGGVFDAGPLGSYLLGDDGRNHRGIRRLFAPQPFAHVDYSRANFQVIGDGLSVRDSAAQDWSRVLSLHVHSKDLRLLGDPLSRRKALKHYVRMSQGHRRVRREFDAWAFRQWLQQALARRLAAPLDRRS